MLDPRRLRLLHELHRRGTVGAVAEALSYSPSTVSQQLGVLQREAGTTLFEPAGRRVRLTDAALVLAGHAEELLAAVERAEPEPALDALRSHALDLVLADEWTGAPEPRVPGVDREDLFGEPVSLMVPA